MFKVVTDQLKVSQGWVRCGHCGGVFDASLHLQAETGLQQDRAGMLVLPGMGPAIAPTSAEAVLQHLPEPGPQEHEATVPSPLSADSSIPLHTGSTEFEAKPDSQSDNFDPTEWKRKRHALSLDQAGALGLSRRGEVVIDPTPFGSPPAEGAPKVVVARLKPVTTESLSATSEVVQEVSFIREARRSALWDKPKSRVALGVAAFLLAVLLGLQVTVQQRDAVAALEPGLKPLLLKLCSPLHCDVGPLRRIEAIVIDSSAFNKVEGDSYRLSFSIKNTGSVPVAMPSLEVTVTDNQDQALVRRVLTPIQLGMASGLLNGGSDFSGVVVMQIENADFPVRDSNDALEAGKAVPAAPLRIAGYRVLAFYP